MTPAESTADESEFPSDTMTWQTARSYLEEAGWQVVERPAGVLLTVGSTEIGQLSPSLPADEDLVDGHAMLRAAGAGRLDVALAATINSAEVVDEVLVGLNWSMVRVGDKAGIARSPERGTQGARTVRGDQPIAGQTLGRLAGWLCSLDPLRRSIGLAAINAYWNHPENGAVASGWGFSGYTPPGEGLVIVGGFRAVQQRLSAARIVEREPQGNDIPASKAAEALANAKSVAITAQTLMNGSLEPLLAQISPTADRLLVGPSTPVAPVLFEHGLDRAAGLAITDVPGATAFIKETGTMIAKPELTATLQISR